MTSMGIGINFECCVLTLPSDFKVVTSTANMFYTDFFCIII